MKFAHALTITATTLLTAMSVVPALAEMSPADVDRLGKDLTPSGAERAGNKDGTIPAWEGGLTQRRPVGKPEMGSSTHSRMKSFVVVINQQNADQYKDKLSPG